MSSQKPRRKLSWWVRWLHTYVSLIGFGALIFFSFTGLTLNHAEWFEGIETTTERAGSAPAELVNSSAGPAAGIALLAWLRAEEQLDGHAGRPETDGAEIRVSLQGAGYVADVTINQESGEYAVFETRRGLIAIINDLHKGRHTSGAWSLVIDLSAIVLVLCGATGIWLLWFLKKIRIKGLVTAAAGSVVLIVLYLGWQ